MPVYESDNHTTAQVHLTSDEIKFIVSISIETLYIVVQPFVV